ncbi:Gtr1/RagA G protein conserved region-domain-containing protein [Mycotypha africana]|uniref:Gtr1/RagA G protein conserved region-domain-containing protein n=1 Tax=Mycotypha africana TaxID=64632 RepID=UPI0023009611|nr:Gtr1/RagA G protein conserved region-domain-containing protein [Mycotypha africana]KAI8967224.1 Gtr1/RagA G protein conserved region-domain-containing protein [Mycotypha africana]
MLTLITVVLWDNSTDIQFLKNLRLNVWDCSGQDAAFQEYFTTYQNQVFKDVHVLIYVFDAVSVESEKDIHYYQSCLESILIHSPRAIVYCLLHKMDFLPKGERREVFQKKKVELHMRSEPIHIKVFSTSIWDESLYAAWSQIIHGLIPHNDQLQLSLETFCKICGAAEVVLFEKRTFLVVGTSATIHHPDIHRFEKISSIIKQFNLSTRKEGYSEQMEIRGTNFTAFFDHLTENTSILLIISDPGITSAATRVNISAARNHFDRLEDHLASDTPASPPPSFLLSPSPTTSFCTSSTSVISDSEFDVAPFSSTSGKHAS